MSAQHIEIVLDDAMFQSVLEELELTERPPSIVLNHPGFASNTTYSKKTAEVRGVYDPSDHTVYVSNGNKSLQRERLIETTTHLLVSFLHELRHAHQHTHWAQEELAGGTELGYWESHKEVDARAWSEGAAQKYKGLIRVQRRPVGGRTGFQRMSERAGR